MNILGHDIPQPLIEEYLRAIKYNQSMGTQESDQMQRDTHLAIFDFVGLDRARVTGEDRKFIRAIDELTEYLMREGY